MKKIFGQNDPSVIEYVEELCQPEDAILKEIRVRSTQEGLPTIQVGDMDAHHLTVLTQAFHAEKIVEIGTLGGYSGVALCRGMQPEGKLYTFEFTPKHAEVARESFKRAGFEKQVEIFVGAALENLPKIEAQGPFDLVFIDADKVNYPNYLKWAHKNIKKGGAVLADNTFAWGLINSPQIDDPGDKRAVAALREYNHQAVRSGQFVSTILPTGEGLTLSVKI